MRRAAVAGLAVEVRAIVFGQADGAGDMLSAEAAVCARREMIEKCGLDQPHKCEIRSSTDPSSKAFQEYALLSRERRALSKRVPAVVRHYSKSND